MTYHDEQSDGDTAFGAVGAIVLGFLILFVGGLAWALTVVL